MLPDKISVKIFCNRKTMIYYHIPKKIGNTIFMDFQILIKNEYIDQFLQNSSI